MACWFCSSSPFILANGPWLPPMINCINRKIYILCLHFILQQTRREQRWINHCIKVKSQPFWIIIYLVQFWLIWRVLIIVGEGLLSNSLLKLLCWQNAYFGTHWSLCWGADSALTTPVITMLAPLIPLARRWPHSKHGQKIWESLNGQEPMLNTTCVFHQRRFASYSLLLFYYR